MLTAIGMTASHTAALAAAWTLQQGQGYGYVTTTASAASKAFDGTGTQQRIPRYRKVESQAWIEYGITDWFTVIVSPSLQYVDIAAPIDASRTGLGYTDLGGRVRLWTDGSWVVSAQTTVRIPGTYDKSNVAAIGYTDPEIDVRGLVGYSSTLGGLPAFVDVQIAQRFRLGGPPDEFRADITFGIRPQERWLLLAQSFNVVSEGTGSWGYASFAYHKLQLSAVYALTSALSLQVGGYTTYAGRNALQENGLVLGAWFRF
ncbi:transporter [Rhodopseudomonas sp. NSM]|uniref:transporter n=1 Tax=Rhodopseudomonas sp. NSM TaxID=3457630 RepID=UPI0040356968